MLNPAIESVIKPKRPTGPVADHLSGYECPCQDSEPAIREDKGDFVWRGVPR